jgi:hypothetical protein
MRIVAPILIGLLYVAVVSLVPEPARRTFNAVFVAGAGAAYLSSGALGPAELLFTTAITICAYKGLTSYRWIGVAWLLHTVLDVIHDGLGKPILPFAPHSSFGCAICDPVIALWCLANGPSLRQLRARPRIDSSLDTTSPSGT